MHKAAGIFLSDSNRAAIKTLQLAFEYLCPSRSLCKVLKQACTEYVMYGVEEIFLVI